MPADSSTEHTTGEDSADKPTGTGQGGSALDRAAAQGPLEGVAAEDAAQQRGEDHSGDNERSSEGSGVLNKLLPHTD